MIKYTFSELVDIMDCNLADVVVGRMMIIIEDETGLFPSWTDIAPDWVVKNCLCL